MSVFEGREREPGVDEESNRPDERNAPPRTESEESKETRPAPQSPEAPGREPVPLRPTRAEADRRGRRLGQRIIRAPDARRVGSRADVLASGADRRMSSESSLLRPGERIVPFFAGLRAAAASRAAARLRRHARAVLGAAGLARRRTAGCAPRSDALAGPLYGRPAWDRQRPDRSRSCVVGLGLATVVESLGLPRAGAAHARGLLGRAGRRSRDAAEFLDRVSAAMAELAPGTAPRAQALRPRPARAGRAAGLYLADAAAQLRARGPSAAAMTRPRVARRSTAESSSGRRSQQGPRSSGRSSRVGAEAAVAYLGDDRTDEDAFAALRDRGLAVLVRSRRRDKRGRGLDSAARGAAGLPAPVAARRARGVRLRPEGRR